MGIRFHYIFMYMCLICSRLIADWWKALGFYDNPTWFDNCCVVVRETFCLSELQTSCRLRIVSLCTTMLTLTSLSCRSGYIGAHDPNGCCYCHFIVLPSDLRSADHFRFAHDLSKPAWIAAATFVTIRMDMLSL